MMQPHLSVEQLRIIKNIYALMVELHGPIFDIEDIQNKDYMNSVIDIHFNMYTFDSQLRRFFRKVRELDRAWDNFNSGFLFSDLEPHVMDEIIKTSWREVNQLMPVLEKCFEELKKEFNKPHKSI